MDFSLTVGLLCCLQVVSCRGQIQKYSEVDAIPRLVYVRCLIQNPILKKHPYPFHNYS